jgi:hypothetical protein
MSDPVELNFERLLDWVEGRLPAQEAEAVAQQITTSQEAQAIVEWIQAFRRVSGQLVLTTPPSAVRLELVQQFAEYAARQQQPTLWRRLLASLQFDSALQPAPAGTRSGGGNITRQLVYTSADADIMLNSQARKAEQSFNLFGELLPNRTDLMPDEFCAQLLQSEQEVAITMLDDLGQFSFEGLARGDYQLILSSATVEIELDGVKI